MSAFIGLRGGLTFRGRVNGLRWRVAQRIAPNPIIAAPMNGGPAILVRSGEQTRAYAWITPKTLDIEVKSELGIEKFGETVGDEYARPNWQPSQRGTFSGTL